MPTMLVRKNVGLYNRLSGASIRRLGKKRRCYIYLIKDHIIMVNKRDVSPMPSPPSEHLYLEMVDSPSPPRPPTRRCQVSNLRAFKKKEKEDISLHKTN